MTLRIAELRATRVRMPLEAPTRWALGVHHHVVRTLLEASHRGGLRRPRGDLLRAGHRAPVGLAGEALRGLDPLHVTVVQERLAALGGSYDTMMPLGLRGGIETACLDAAGKALGVPVWALLGGAVRDRIEVAAYLFYRERSADGRNGGEDSPEAIVAAPSSSSSATASAC